MQEVEGESVAGPYVEGQILSNIADRIGEMDVELRACGSEESACTD